MLHLIDKGTFLALHMQLSRVCLLILRILLLVDYDHKSVSCKGQQCSICLQLKPQCKTILNAS